MATGTDLLQLDEAPGAGVVGDDFQVFGKMPQLPGKEFRVPASRLPGAKSNTPTLTDAAQLDYLQTELANDRAPVTPAVRYAITGDWNATGDDTQVVYVQAATAVSLERVGTLRRAGQADIAVIVDLVAGTAVPLPDLATQQQHTQQLSTLAVQSSQVYGYLEAGGAPVGYASLDASTADARQKVFQTFNAPLLTLTTSNPANGDGWAFSTNGQGTTLKLIADVVLTLRGDDAGSLTFTDFYIEGSRGSKLRLLTAAPDTTPAAQLPFLSARYCGTPVEFVNGGAALLSGYYVSLTGTGTVYALEPFQADNVATGVTIKRLGGVARLTVANYSATQAGQQPPITIPAAARYFAVTVDGDTLQAGVDYTDDGAGTLTILASASVVVGSIVQYAWVTAGNITASADSYTKQEVDARLAVLPLAAARSANYVLQLSDAGCLVPVTSTSGVMVTVPANASVPFPVGTTLYVAQDGAGPVTLAGASGVVLQTADGYKVPGQWTDVALHKRDLNTWVLKGGVN